MTAFVMLLFLCFGIGIGWKMRGWKITKDKNLG